MKMLHYFVLLLIALTVSAQARTWTAKTGQTIDGEFVNLEDETVWIQLSEGKQAKIKLGLLSDEDQQFVQNEMKKVDNPFQIEDSPFVIVDVPQSPLNRVSSHSIELKGHTEEVGSAVFSPDGNKIVTASSDETVRIWDALSGKELHQLKPGFSVEKVHFFPDSKKLGNRSRIFRAVAL